MPIDLPVPLWMWITSQAIGVVSIAWWFIVYQQKNKEKALWMSGIGKVFSIITNIFLFNFIMAGLILIKVPRDTTFALLERRNKKGNPVKKWLSIFLLCLFCALSIATTLISVFVLHETFWFNWVLLAGALFVNFGKWKKGIVIFWVSVIFWTTLSFINALFFWNFTTMISCVIILTSLFISMARHFRNKKKKALAENNAAEEPNAEVLKEETGAELEVETLVRADTELRSPVDDRFGLRHSPAENLETEKSKLDTNSLHQP